MHSRSYLYFAGLLLLAADLGAQPREALTWDEGLIWDDFTYRNGAAVRAASRWCITDPGEFPKSEADCTWRRHKAWYVTNWAEKLRGPSGGLATESLAGSTHLRLTLQDGEEYQWGRIPVIVSGFTRRTGTWYARVRLQDLSERSPGASTTFWTHSPFWACKNVEPGSTCSHASEKYWSEWNFEWTTVWNVNKESRGPWMSTGAVVDGDGAMLDPSPLRGNPNADSFTCSAPSGKVLPWNECRRYLINAVDRPDEYGSYADLMVRFDGRIVHWEVIAWAGDDDLEHPWIRAEAETMELGPGQPVATIFSATPPMGRTIEKNHWFAVDRFIYTPSTDRSVEDMIEVADRLTDAGIDRLNSTGIRLEVPRVATRARVETVEQGLRRGEFLIIPPENYIAYYDITWTYRVADETSGSGRPRFPARWTELPDHSMKVEIPPTSAHRYAEVNVTYRLHRDKDGLHHGPLPFERQGSICLSSSDFGRSFVVDCTP